jgi:hypothetical protein
MTNPFAKPADCDYPGNPSVRNGRCMCIVCARCKHHTGNGHTGHYTTWCRVTQRPDGQEQDGHFCCPGDCELHAIGVDLGNLS